jgi:hypothetical protein
LLPQLLVIVLAPSIDRLTTSRRKTNHVRFSRTNLVLYYAAI